MKTIEITETLEIMKKRIAMYIHPVSIDSLSNHLSGIRIGFAGHHSVPDQLNDYWFKAQEERGWKRQAIGPVPQMKNKGMPDAEIMVELIEIEKLTIKNIAGAVNK